MKIEKYGDHPIAVIGMACRFPKAENTSKYWSLICEGESGITQPNNNNRDPNYITAAGRLEEYDHFDSSLFGIESKSASYIDPQHRLLLELTRSLFDDAGYDPEKYKGRIGVYTSVAFSSYLVNNLFKNAEVYQSQGFDNLLMKNDKSHANSIISYTFNLQGESYNIDTACSSSLSAIHLSIKSLNNFDTDMVVAGGARIILPHDEGDYYNEGGILSPRGICSPFDSEADGSIFGSGGGLVLLKRLDDAIKDQDNILSVIVCSEVNNDGHQKVGFTAPSINGQEKVWSELLSKAKISPDAISFIECHGTGTKLGDPVELAAIEAAFTKRTDKKNYCALGAVKANIGHLDAAAGVAGLINLTNILQNQQIPKLKNFKSINESIDLDESPFYIVDECSEQNSGQEEINYGAVNSLGIGGTNVALLVKKYQAEPVTSRHSDIFYPITISGNDSHSLKNNINNLVNYLKEQTQINVSNISFSLDNRIKDKLQVVFAANSVENIISTLESNQYETIEAVKNTRKNQKQIVFVYPGQSSQYSEMFSELYKYIPIYKDSFNYVASLFEPHINADITQFYSQTFADELNINDVEISQALIFTSQYAMTEVIKGFGIKPGAVLGHSFGEYTAAFISGIWSLEDTVKVISYRGKLLKSYTFGGMILFRTNDIDIVNKIKHRAKFSLINTNEEYVVSGNKDEIAEIQKFLRENKVKNIKLSSDVPFHSELLNNCADSFSEYLLTLNTNSPKLNFYPTISIDQVNTKKLTHNYWKEHLIKNVDMPSAISKLDMENKIFIEIGPGNSVTNMIKKLFGDANVINASRNQADSKSDSMLLITSLIKLQTKDMEVDYSILFDNANCRRVSLPGYSFNRKLCWVYPDGGHENSKIENLQAESVMADPNESLPKTHVLKDKVRADLLVIWSKYIDSEALSLQDDFFAIGGDSLTATMILTSIRQKYEIRISLDDFFNAGNIEKLADIILIHKNSEKIKEIL